MAIFSPLQQDVNPMDPVDVGSPVASGLASLSKLFLSAPEQRAPTQNEVFAARVKEFGEVIQNPNWNPVEATMGELRKFGAAYPEFSTQAFDSAKTAMNESVLAYENALTTTQQIQEKTEFDWNTSPEGIYANARAAEYQTEEERAAYLNTEKARWVTTNAENARIKREVETQGAYTTISDTAWKNNSFFAKTEADIFARGLTDLTLAISADPTAKFNLDETGITQLIPELRGTVVDQRNIVSVANIARSSLETRYRKEISSRTGIPDDQLGLAPDTWNKTVFNTYDTTLTWINTEVDPATIQKRLEGDAFTAYAQAGVPVAYLGIMGRLGGSNPALQSQLTASLTGVVGAFNDKLMAGELEEAQRILKESSTKELTDARYAFTELVAVMSGQSKLAVTYEEVQQEQKDSEISKALTGAYEAHTELQRTEGPTRWNRAAWKQNFEVPAEAINRRAAVDKDFALSTSRFLSSDIMMDLGNLRDAAAPNGVNISISDNGQVVVSSTDQAPPLRGAGVGVARRPITPGDKLNSFVTEKKALIDDINYKMTVLGRLGETGSSTLDILRAEVPSATVGAGAGNDELGGGAVNDTLRGAGSGSTGTFGVVSVVNAGKGFTDVRKEDGTVERREGTRAWRNNNPGNIEYGDFAKKNGAVGTDGRFAVFPSYEQGREAKKKLLWETRGYSGLTIAGAINRYAPPSENDTGSYVNSVASSIGVGPDTPMAELNDSQKEVMLDAMERVEGFKTGSVNGVQAPAQATRARPSDGNAVASASGPAVQRAVNNAPSASSTMAATTPAATAEVIPMEATAALPEAIPTEAAGGLQGASELSPAIALDKDVQAFIQEIAGDPDKTYASEAEFVAAQEAGELEAGDTVVVNGEIYVVRKNGSVRRLGTVNS
jgi:hypothetical protein